MSDIGFDGGIRKTRTIGDDFNRFVNNYAVNNSLPNSVVGEGLKRFSTEKFNQPQQEFAMTLPESMQSAYAAVMSKFETIPYNTGVSTGGLSERFIPSDADYNKMKKLDLKPDTQEV